MADLPPDTQAAVDAIVAAWPPLTGEQIATLKAILKTPRPGAR